MLEEEFLMRENESEDKYIIRACAAGLSRGMTWAEIACVINAETERNSDESTYRRKYKAYMMGVHDAKKEEVVSESPARNETEEYTLEEQQLRDRYKTSTEMSPYYRLMRQDSRFERFYCLVAKEIKRLPEPEYIGIEPYDGAEDMEYVLGLADLHIGANFKAENNSYSIEEAERRFGVLLGYMKSFVEKHNLYKINVLMLGDLIQGILRISDLKLNELPVVDAFVKAARMLASFLNQLSEFCYVDFKMVSYSNHDQLRPLGTKASELASEDLGKVLFAYLTDTLVFNKRISIYTDTDKSKIKFNIFGFKCAAMHGHDVSNPNTISKDLANRDREFYDYIFLGHTHSGREFINAEGINHNIQTLVLPSFVGSCPYADKLMVGSKAGCGVYGFDRKYGHTETYYCILN